MAKKILLVLSIIFVLIVGLFIILSNQLEKKANNKNNQLEINQQRLNNISITDKKNKKPTLLSPTITPKSETKIIFKDQDFKVEYEQKTNQYKIIKKKSDLKTDIKIDQWLKNKNIDINDVLIINQSEPTSTTTSTATFNNPLPTVSIIINQNKNEEGKKFNHNLNIFFDLFRVFLKTANNNNLTQIQITPNENLLITPQTTNNSSKKQSAGQYIYYAQCGSSFANYPLPLGCTICEAGCGPTTVAMITASYVDKTITPITIVDLYKQKGYYLGCAGSRNTDARTVISDYGLKTTDFLSFNLATIDQAASEFKHYLDTGWTIFVLANFCDQGCGHFFWIVEIDKSNNTWAYDPYYGRLQNPPYNEKTRYPFPKYRYAFGVKK